MINRLCQGLAVVCVLSGCQLLPQQNDEVLAPLEAQPQVKYRDECLFRQDNAIPHNCDLDYWLNYWIGLEKVNWPERKKTLAELDNSKVARLQKVLLSQGRGVPYQDRLRSQFLLDELMPDMTERGRALLNTMIYLPNQELLEFESALAMLTKINTNQLRQIEELQKRNQQQEQNLKVKQEQLDQLLKIEASMVDKSEGAKL